MRTAAPNGLTMHSINFLEQIWQAFQQGVPWTLVPKPGGYAQVYALFKDDAGNDSVGPSIGSIFYTASAYLPLMLQNNP